MATDIPGGPSTGGVGPGEPGGIAGLPATGREGGWTAGRIIAVVIGSVLVVVSLGLLGGGAALMWADQAMRTGGYLTTAPATYSSTGYALASDQVDLGWGLLMTGVVGDVRLRVTATTPGRPILVAIGPADRVSAYLSGTEYTTVTGAGTGGLVVHDGAERPAPPRAARIWVAQATGPGTQVLRWTAREGDWTVVAMNPDGSAGVRVRADAGVSAPGLFQLAIEVVIGGILAGLLSAALIIVPVRLAGGTGE